MPSTTRGGRRKTTTRKISLNLTEETDAAVDLLADEQNVTVSEVVRRAVAMAAFFAEQQRQGATILLTRDNGKTLEKVHFLFK